MTNKEMNERINKIINDFLFPLEKHENSTINLRAVSILLRGFVTCNNDIVDKSAFLLTGINPSFNGKYFPKGFDDPFTFREATSTAKPKEFWFKKKEQFGDLCNTMAYLDLFPIRETDQRIFSQAFAPFNEFMAQILDVTQEAIEQMHPQLIVHANRRSMSYWGRNQGDWMGYEFERVDPTTFDDEVKKCITKERLKLFPFYRITGFSKHPQRINKEIYPSKTGLKDTFFMEYVMEYRAQKHRQMLYKPDEWKSILNWVLKQPRTPEQ